MVRLPCRSCETSGILNSGISKKNYQEAYNQSQLSNAEIKATKQPHQVSSKILKIVNELYSTQNSDTISKGRSYIHSINDFKVKDRSGIPSNEDLFVFGWAKAYDKERNRHYYYTLDRSQVVWKNPISAKK